MHEASGCRCSGFGVYRDIIHTVENERGSQTEIELGAVGFYTEPIKRGIGFRIFGAGFMVWRIHGVSDVNPKPYKA